ncbi:hypothetical protein SAMN04487948_10121 [Halogranum amylolyticum]|uniref:Uncharacterized protein n=1 Tax=Halogranum amylolyticum TaxID=660520 RepID=A0A1H8MQN1_9EURY|nr:hypothetical protein SAMN04487948_10121 [Halogranum amylolyticum]
MFSWTLIPLKQGNQFRVMTNIFTLGTHQRKRFSISSRVITHSHFRLLMEHIAHMM